MALYSTGAPSRVLELLQSDAEFNRQLTLAREAQAAALKRQREAQAFESLQNAQQMMGNLARQQQEIETRRNSLAWPYGFKTLDAGVRYAESLGMTWPEFTGSQEGQARAAQMKAILPAEADAYRQETELLIERQQQLTPVKLAQARAIEYQQQQAQLEQALLTNPSAPAHISQTLEKLRQQHLRIDQSTTLSPEEKQKYYESLEQSRARILRMGQTYLAQQKPITSTEELVQAGGAVRLSNGEVWSLETDAKGQKKIGKRLASNMNLAPPPPGAGPEDWQRYSAYQRALLDANTFERDGIVYIYQPDSGKWDIVQPKAKSEAPDFDALVEQTYGMKTGTLLSAMIRTEEPVTAKEVTEQMRANLRTIQEGVLREQTVAQLKALHDKYGNTAEADWHRIDPENAEADRQKLHQAEAVWLKLQAATPATSTAQPQRQLPPIGPMR
ncbi:MAG: hypothetical protein AB1508_18935 [Pseudomonadota bacterium]